MSNKEIIEELDLISNLIKEEKYDDVSQHIEKIKKSLEEKDEPVAKYIDGLVDNLK